MDYSGFKNKMILKECVRKILPKKDFLSFAEEINRRQQSVFKNKSGFQEEDKKPENGLLSACFKTLEKEGIFLETPEKESAFLEELKKHLLEMPSLKLEIAFEPAEKFLEKISLWLEKELGQKIILDINVNSKIIGGAIIEYQGKYLNLSLEKEIDRLTLPIR